MYQFFARQPDGSFVNTTSPALQGAVVTIAGGLRTLRFKDGTTWRFRTSDGLLVSQTDRNGNTVTMVRDSQGRVTDLIEPRGRALTFSYTGTNLRIDRIADSLGREVRYGYDAQGRLEGVTDPVGGVARYTYDANHRMLTLTDPRGITFLTNEYDGAGRIVKQTQADGGIWTFAYTTTGSFISRTMVTDPRGNPTTYRFNSFGYLTSQTDALGQTTTFTRDPATNQLLATTDPLGRVTRFEYDGSGNVTKITDPQGNVRTFTYDPTFNKVTSITDPLGNMTTFEYDSQGNLTRITDPLTNTTTITYNPSGQPVTTTDPLRNVTRFEYDNLGNLTAIVDPLGNRTMRSYDLVSRLIAQTDPLGKSTRFSYDALNHLVNTVDALNGGTTFGYDPNGNLLTVTDARGSTITHEYDSMDRLSKRFDQLGRVETFSYDGNGNLTSTTDRKNQTTTFSYDPLNRRVQATYADGAIGTFTYDAGGRLIQADDTADPHRPIVMAYDALDGLLAETTALGTVGYQYDALGRRTQMTVGGQSPVAYTYDAASRLRSITQAPLNPVTIDYDGLGRRTLLTLPNQVSTEYQYDGASRLTALIYRNVLDLLSDLTYQYDPAGNRVGMGGSFARTLLPDPVPSATYDAANRQLAFGDKTMTFDNNGNLATLTESAGTTTYTWDARNRLTNLTGPGLVANFAYDAHARRAQKSINTQASQLQYDGVDTVRELMSGETVTYLRTLSIDEPLVRIDATGAATYLHDALGSTVVLKSSSGSLSSYSYDPFGRTLASAPASGSPFQFTGRENDETGLYHFRARYYMPSIGRFLQEDPLGFNQGIHLCPTSSSIGATRTALLRGEPSGALLDLNPYAYGSNNPLRFVDPLGLESATPQQDCPGTSYQDCLRRARLSQFLCEFRGSKICPGFCTYIMRGLPGYLMPQLWQLCTSFCTSIYSAACRKEFENQAEACRRQYCRPQSKSER